MYVLLLLLEVCAMGKVRIVDSTPVHFCFCTHFFFFLLSTIRFFLLLSIIASFARIGMLDGGIGRIYFAMYLLLRLTTQLIDKCHFIYNNIYAIWNLVNSLALLRTHNFIK